MNEPKRPFRLHDKTILLPGKSYRVQLCWENPAFEAALALFYEAGFREYKDPILNRQVVPLRLPGLNVQVVLDSASGCFLLLTGPKELERRYYAPSEAEDFLLRLLCGVEART